MENADQMLIFDKKTLIVVHKLLICGYKILDLPKKQ